MKRYFVSIYTDGPDTRWNVIDRRTQEWIRRFPTKEAAEAYATTLEDPMAGTMTLNLSEKEMATLEALAAEKEMTKTAIMRQALRLYQLVNIRLNAGEKMMFSGDEQRRVEFIGL